MVAAEAGLMGTVVKEGNRADRQERDSGHAPRERAAGPGQAEQQLPDQVDTDKNADLLQCLGINPQEILERLWAAGDPQPLIQSFRYGAAATWSAA